jgi:hypothetical protein
MIYVQIAFWIVMALLISRRCWEFVTWPFRIWLQHHDEMLYQVWWEESREAFNEVVRIHEDHRWQWLDD